MFKFLLGILTIVASTSLLSSCFSDPTFGENPTVVPPSVETEYTVTVNTNADADKLIYKVEGKDDEKVGTTFHPTSDGILVLSKDGYVGQAVKIALGENKNIVLNVTLIETPTSDYSVADAKASTEDTPISGNDGSTMTLPAGLQTSGVGDDANFGIGVYSVVAVADEPEVKEDVVTNDEAHDVLVAVCEPSGAVFTPDPVTISVAAQNANGLSFQCINEEDEANGIAPTPVTVEQNKLSAQVSHFSNWTFSLMARVIDIQTTTETLFDGNILIHTGSNIFNYNAKTGVSSDRSGIAETFLIGQFGSKLANVAKTGTLTATGEGSAHIQVVQDKKIITYKSGSNTTFKATVYGAIHVNVISTTYDTSEHSGGTGGVH